MSRVKTSRSVERGTPWYQLLLTGAAIASLLYSAPRPCHADSPSLSPPSASAPPVRIGVITPLSGDFLGYGALVRKGIESVPADGVQLIFEDEGCDARRAVAAYRKLVDVDRVRYLLGPSCGSPQHAVAPLIPSDDVLALVTSSATEEIYQQAKGRVFFSQYSIEQESRFNASQMNKRGFQQALLVYFDNEFSRAHESAFRKSFQGKIGDVIRFPSFDTTYVRNAALKAKHGGYDVIYVPDATPFLLGFLTELRKIGAPPIPVYSVYSAQMADVLAAEGPHAEGLRYSYPADAGEDALYYFPRLAAQMLFAAIKECGNDTTCTAHRLHEKYSFDEHNTRRSEIELRTVKNGQFAQLPHD